MAEEYSHIDQDTKYAVFGYIRTIQRMFCSTNVPLFMSIPLPIPVLCTIYFNTSEHWNIPNKFIANIVEAGQTFIPLGSPNKEKMTDHPYENITASKDKKTIIQTTHRKIKPRAFLMRSGPACMARYNGTKQILASEKCICTWSVKFTCMNAAQSSSTPQPTVKIGVVNNSKNTVGYFYSNCGRTETLKTTPTTSSAFYGANWGNTDIIDVILNLKNKTISFRKNGKDQGVAFNNIKTLPNPFYYQLRFYFGLEYPHFTEYSISILKFDLSYN